MPKKTRKEKIIAEYRKRLKLLQLNQNNASYIPSVPEKPIESSTLSQKPETIQKKEKTYGNEEDSLITSYFKKDFQKSLLLIAIVITLEISLYFATINNYLKLGH